MKKLLKYLSSYKKESILSPLFKMLEASFELIVPLVVASIIDHCMEGATVASASPYILKGFALLIVLGLVGLICSCTAQFFAAKAATGFATGLRHDLFAHLLSLDFKDIDNLGTSTMITRMTSDVNTIQSGVNMFLRLFLRSPFIVLGATVMAFTIDVQCALIFVGVVILLGIVVYIIMNMNIPALKIVQGKLDNVLNLTRENLSGVRVIRAFTREEEELDAFRNKNNDLAATQLKAGRISGLLNPLTYSIINLAIVLLIVKGGLKVGSGALTTGAVVALYNYMSQILVELIKFASLVVTINKALASANRIDEVFDISQGLTANSDGVLLDNNIHSIEFDNVFLRYHEKSDEALSNVSFRIEEGQTIGIIGGTGSGKTSLVNLISRYYDATSGNIFINGKNIKEFEVTSLRKSIGNVLQKAVLFRGTIKDNLLWGNENASDEEIMEAVNLSCADDVVKLKGGLDANIEAGGKNLSGGQRQRLSIARALVRKPSVLILDDSSSALDFVTDLKLRTNIKGLSYRPIVFIVSQRSSAVSSADIIVVLDDGNVVGIGTHDELLKDCEVYQEIYNSQLRREVE